MARGLFSERTKLGNTITLWQMLVSSLSPHVHSAVDLGLGE